MLAFTSTFWIKDVYSHGWIVPLIAAYLFWIRRKPLGRGAGRSDRWIGVALVAACLGVRVWAAYYDYNNPDRLSYRRRAAGRVPDRRRHGRCCGGPGRRWRFCCSCFRCRRSWKTRC